MIRGGPCGSLPLCRARIEFRQEVGGTDVTVQVVSKELEKGAIFGEYFVDAAGGSANPA